MPARGQREPTFTVKLLAVFPPKKKNSAVTIGTGRKYITKVIQTPTIIVPKRPKIIQPKASLNRTQKIVSQNVVSCSHCNKFFTESARLQQHLDHTGHGSSPMNIVKETERKPQQIRISRPRLTNVNGQPKPFKCELCVREFRLQTELNDHNNSPTHLQKEANAKIREQTPQQKYFCQLCSVHLKGEVSQVQHELSSAHRKNLESKTLGLMNLKR